jgi:hypothetical protein
MPKIFRYALEAAVQRPKTTVLMGFGGSLILKSAIDRLDRWVHRPHQEEIAEAYAELAVRKSAELELPEMDADELEWERELLIDLESEISRRDR